MAHTDTMQQRADAGAWSAGWWQSILLGLVLIFGGLFMLRNAVAATVASAIVFGVVLLATGVFEVVHAFWAAHWSGLFWRLLVGVLYAVGGAILIGDPLTASVLLTLGFAAALIASGAGKSGNPCDRLTAPYWCDSRVISRMTDSVNRAAFEDVRGRTLEVING